MSHFREALRLDPGYAAGHHSLAWTLRDMGQLDEAIDEYGRALRIAPTSSVIHNNFGVTLRDKGRLDEAIQQFRESIRIDPAWPVPHFNLGSTLQAGGRRDEAIDEYGQALRLDADDVGAHVNLGSALYAKGGVEEAIDHFRQALRLDPNLAPAHVNLGSALYTTGRVEEAIDHFRQALRLNPNSAAARVNLGVSLFAAARHAVLDAAGHAGNPRLGEPERAEKRRQALAWLRADLELQTTMPGGGGSSAQSVAAWQKDPDLAGVRAPAALAKLPDAEREPWQRFWADVAAVVAADPVEQGRAHAARREWARAAAGYARALEHGPTDDGHFWFEYAAVLLLSGDRPGYRAACARLVERCGKQGGPRPYHVARACTLGPESVPDASSPGRLAGDELRRNATQFWSLTELGALAYRSGQLEQSASFFEQSLKADPRPGRAVINWLWLSMAGQRLGYTDEARRRLEEARKWLDRYRDGMPADADEGSDLDLHNWLEAHVLLREAEALLASK